jgi:hypothetical protein
MSNISPKDRISKRNVFYYRARLKNNVFHEVLEKFYALSKEGRLNKKQIADALDKDAGWVTRQFAAPANWTLDTVSDLLLAMDAELEVKAVGLEEKRQKLAEEKYWDASGAIAPPQCSVKLMRKVSANQEDPHWADIPKRGDESLQVVSLDG